MKSTECPHYKPGVCPPSANVVPFHGPADARLVVVGEAPGATENEKGVPFCGDSGRELDRLYLPAAGVARQDVFVANAVCCLPEKGTPSKELVSHCSSRFLIPYVRQRETFAVYVALGRISSEVMQSLLPRTGELPAAARFAKGWLIRAPHPAAAMRDESRTGQIMDEILSAFYRAGRILRGESCRQPEIEHEWSVADSWEEVESVFSEAQEVAMDTETIGVGGPVLCLSLAARDRQHRPLVRSRVLFCRDVTQEEWPGVIGWLSARRVIFHHALYDVEAIARCAGWDAAMQLLASAEDTMLLAYEIRGLPLGLKPLSESLLGIRMPSFESAMEGPFSSALRSHLQTVSGFLRSRQEPECSLVPPLLGDGMPVPEDLLRRRGETLADYRRRLESTDDGRLEPLRGRLLSAPAGMERDAEELAAEVNRRFSWQAAAAAAARAMDRLDGTMDGVRSAIAEARRSAILRRMVPREPHELLLAADRDEVAEYAARDAMATLLLWDELRRIL